MHKAITGDESWCFFYDPRPKGQSSTWKSPGSPRHKIFRADRSKGKIMLKVLFDIQGFVHFEFIPEGRTINKETMLQFFNVFVLRFDEKTQYVARTELGSSSWKYPSTSVALESEFLTKHKIPIISQLTYSPDLPLADFTYFQKSAPYSSDGGLHQSKRWKFMPCALCRNWWKMDYRNVWRSGMDADKSVSQPRGSTLKVVLCK